MNPSWRKPAGVLGIMLLIAIWAVIVTSLSAIVGQWHWVLQAIFYLVAGVVWILPMKPVLAWMER